MATALLFERAHHSGFYSLGGRTDVKREGTSGGTSLLPKPKDTQLGLEAVPVSSNEWHAFRLGFVDGRVAELESLLIAHRLALSDPLAGWESLRALGDQVPLAGRMRAQFLVSLSRRNVQYALDILRQYPDLVSRSEIHALGVELFASKLYTHDLIATLPKNYVDQLMGAELEGELRGRGREAMLSKLASSQPQRKIIQDEFGRSVAEEAGPNVARIRQAFGLLAKAEPLEFDKLQSSVMKSSWWGGPMEIAAVASEMAKLYPAETLTFAYSLEEGRFDALSGAFRQVAREQPDEALAFLNSTDDVTMQNSMLQTLAQLSTDKEVVAECEQILFERGLRMLWKE